MPIYSNNAEKQRAYRERLRQQLQQRIEEHEQKLQRLQKEIDQLITMIAVSAAKETRGRNE